MRIYLGGHSHPPTRRCLRTQGVYWTYSTRTTHTDRRKLLICNRELRVGGKGLPWWSSGLGTYLLNSGGPWLRTHLPVQGQRFDPLA